MSEDTPKNVITSAIAGKLFINESNSDLNFEGRHIDNEQWPYDSLRRISYFDKRIKNATNSSDYYNQIWKSLKSRKKKLVT